MVQHDAVILAGRHDLYTSRTYSVAIRSGDVLFLSDHVGSRSDGSPEPDFEARVRLASANLKTTLQGGGSGLDDIVDVTTFHTDPEGRFGTIMTVKGDVFPDSLAPTGPNATQCSGNADMIVFASAPQHRTEVPRTRRGR